MQRKDRGRGGREAVVTPWRSRQNCRGLMEIAQNERETNEDEWEGWETSDMDGRMTVCQTHTLTPPGYFSSFI